MSALALAFHQFRYDQRIFWRDPASVFFTVMLPVIFLLIFATIFGNDVIPSRDDLKVATYYVPGLITLAVVSATTVNLAINLTEAREAGRLKRLRGTPLPTWAFVAGRVGTSLGISTLSLVVMTVLGRVVYGVTIPTTTLPAVLVTLVVGVVSFSCLGFALTAAIPSQQAAPAVTNATVLPLYFLSGVFIPETEIPAGVLDVADLFPIRHFFEAFLTAWDPNTLGAGFAWGDLAVVALWGAAALAIAVRTFRWTPRG